MTNKKVLFTFNRICTIELSPWAALTLHAACNFRRKIQGQWWTRSRSNATCRTT